MITYGDRHDRHLQRVNEAFQFEDKMRDQSRFEVPDVPVLTLIGDVHGKISEYNQLIKDNECTESIQLGDMGFNQHYTQIDVDGLHHKILAGNHDDYAVHKNGEFIHMNKPRWLGDYGVHKSCVGELFFVRGGRSIDWSQRTPGLDWFDREQLSLTELNSCEQSYEFAKPEIVLTHECPQSMIIPFFGVKEWDGKQIQPSRTANFLQALLEIHRPKLWVFGHFHEHINQTIDGTTFICLEELQHMEVLRDCIGDLKWIIHKKSLLVPVPYW